VLLETGLPGDALELEITESDAMADPEQTVAALVRLRSCGVRVSIDDFGTGYSSLSHLKRLPIDTLKIDKSFVRDVTTDPDAAAIAATVLAMAHTLRLGVVAEGVETEGQRSFLASLGCPRGQGYLFARTLAADDCAAYLAADPARAFRE
jgi:EAL domain-containing protein (putative c-di-GMP-specific phosphodiesterase class I)